MMNIKQRGLVTVRAHKSEAGRGLSYPSFNGRAVEDLFTGGWDVFDVENEKGQLVAVYGFSISKRKAPKRNPQPKKKNAYSALKKQIISFRGNEIDHFSIQEQGKTATFMITLKDGTKIYSWFGGDLAIRSPNKSKWQPLSGKNLVDELIDEYVN